MLFKKPHKLKYTKVESTESYQDENGNWVHGSETTTEKEHKCYSEPNGQGKSITSTDGKDFVFNRRIFLDRNIETIPFNTEVSVFLKDNLISSGTVQLFERFEKHCNIWI